MLNQVERNKRTPKGNSWSRRREEARQENTKNQNEKSPVELGLDVTCTLIPMRFSDHMKCLPIQTLCSFPFIPVACVTWLF